MKKFPFLLLALALTLAACAPAVTPAAPVEVTRIVEVTSTPVLTATPEPTIASTLVPQASPSSVPEKTCAEALTAEQEKIQAKVTAYRESGKAPNWEPNIQLKEHESDSAYRCVYVVTLRSKVSQYDNLNSERYSPADTISFTAIIKSLYPEAHVALIVYGENGLYREIQMEEYLTTLEQKNKKGQDYVVGGFLIYIK